MNDDKTVFGFSKFLGFSLNELILSPEKQYFTVFNVPLDNLFGDFLIAGVSFNSSKHVLGKGSPVNHVFKRIERESVSFLVILILNRNKNSFFDISKTKASAIHPQYFSTHQPNTIFHASSHRALAPVIFLGQVFAVMPVLGISRTSASQLKFTWLSFRVLYTLVVLIGFIIMMVLSILWISINDLSIPILGKL